MNDESADSSIDEVYCEPPLNDPFLIWKAYKAYMDSIPTYVKGTRYDDHAAFMSFYIERQLIHAKIYYQNIFNDMIELYREPQ